MKRILSLVGTVLLYSQINAQDATVKELQKAANKEVKAPDSLDGWKHLGSFIMTLNQGSLSNWSAGGEENTLGVNGLLNLALNYRHGKNNWDNYFDIGLGFQNATSYGKFRKSDDHIDITTKYGYQVSKSWYATFLTNFNSQALAGYNYTKGTKISNFMTPGKLIFSLGMDYKPNENLSVFISPASTRWLFKLDDDFYNTDAFGVPAQGKSYKEFGAYFTAKYNKAITTWATYTGRLDLYSNYKRDPQNVDVIFNNMLVMKFNKWLGTSISVDMIYDDNVIAKTQLKETLGIGLTLKL